jgi:hypothetical protein
MPSPESWPHGVRARYVAGCRCDDCRRANREYAASRAKAKVYGRDNGLVDAAPVRAHLRALSRKGVGRRAVAAATDVAESLIQLVVRGQQKQVRATTARRLLAVTAQARGDASLVPAGPTWKRLEALLVTRFTEAGLARRLGSKAKAPKIQIRRDKVLASTEAKVERLYREVMGVV